MCFLHKLHFFFLLEKHLDGPSGTVLSVSSLHCEGMFSEHFLKGSNRLPYFLRLLLAIRPL